ncbi:MAG: hypothetical protein M1838_000890 [Thelocarpon superellum]|nr:MAG: hypothetical protein M1838_000890 [Thelocarpon superellum]
MAAHSGQDDGASPREIVLEACRRNNTELLDEVVDTVSHAPLNSGGQRLSPEEAVADLLNHAVDGIGNHCLHLAASYGSYEVLDALLDHEGLEVDPIDRLESDTPLHKAVRYVNDLSRDRWDDALQLVELLLDAGADPRVRNKAKLRPMDLADPANTALRSTLQKAEFALLAGADVIQEDDDDGPTGSASDDE